MVLIIPGAPITDGVVDTLPSGQCVSLFLELVSTTYQHTLKYYNEDTTKFGSLYHCMKDVHWQKLLKCQVIPLFSPEETCNWCMFVLDSDVQVVHIQFQSQGVCVYVHLYAGFRASTEQV